MKHFPFSARQTLPLQGLDTVREMRARFQARQQARENKAQKRFQLAIETLLAMAFGGAGFVSLYYIYSLAVYLNG